MELSEKLCSFQFRFLTRKGVYLKKNYLTINVGLEFLETFPFTLSVVRESKRGSFMRLKKEYEEHFRLSVIKLMHIKIHRTARYIPTMTKLYFIMGAFEYFKHLRGIPATHKFKMGIIKLTVVGEFRSVISSYSVT